MAKTKSFAEKMMKGSQPKDESVTYKVIKPKVSAKGSIRFEEKIVKVQKGENEQELLGI